MESVRSRGNSHFPKFWLLHKSQPSSGTEVPLYLKEAFPLSPAEGTNGYFCCLLAHQSTCWPLGPPQGHKNVPVRYLRAHASILALNSSSTLNFSRSWASFPLATHSPYNPDISALHFLVSLSSTLPLFPTSVSLCLRSAPTSLLAMFNHLLAMFSLLVSFCALDSLSSV